MADDKTNAVRIAQSAGAAYRLHAYSCPGPLDGVTVARLIGRPAEMVFKTLVAAGKSGGFWVFVVPVAKELDLKAAARAAGEKSVAMIAARDITPVTGYVRGGCSPIGMKKAYPTLIDDSARDLDAIVVSAGRLGVQLELRPGDLVRLVNGRYAPLT
ncbi:MAG: Cys-tRNA(Pro) deacylase [Clostridiales bacterium]|mgnify:FL=1|nr:Cys-tRNA(Pro) deacylase [Clostridiales bacterium]